VTHTSFYAITAARAPGSPAPRIPEKARREPSRLIIGERVLDLPKGLDVTKTSQLPKG